MESPENYSFDGDCTIADFKTALADVRANLDQARLNGLSPSKLLQNHSKFIDSLLVNAWRHFFEAVPPSQAQELIAVGGYGRQELHPYSDIDLLVLLPKIASEHQERQIEAFIRFLWDIGLEVGHSTRAIKDCIEWARKDITVVTNLTEARLIEGSGKLLLRLHEHIGPNKMWSAKKFFAAKREEQVARHLRYGDTAYNLEPHIKEGPGGLRDIQTIQWVGHRYFGSPDLSALAKEGFLTTDEMSTLVKGRELLWRIRNALHFTANRCEDRLLFDYQREIAAEFGYKDTAQLAVEKLMKRYFRTVKELRLLNEILLQHFEEAILQPGEKRTTQINKRFRVVEGMLEVSSNRVFARQPFALLEAFLLLAQRPDIRDIRGNTVRLIRTHAKLINPEFRKDLRCRSLFMEILRAPSGQTHALRKMDAYGILAAYIPAFGRVTGQMQHDLFHAYTVDAHLLFVVRNLRRFDIPKHDHELPECSQIMQRLFKKHRLYLAAIFHDIAKGRGGDHSKLGERDAFRFCKRHDLSDYDANFVAWLVRAHLLMSWFAQREDISDSSVIERFANEVGDQERLDNLYLLTAADMRATSPKVWNDWKGKLLSDLYHQTSRALLHGIGSSIGADEKINELKGETLKILEASDTQAVTALWKLFDQDYFLRNNPDSLAWHSSVLLSRAAAELPTVECRTDKASGSIRFFVCSPDSERLLSETAAGFDQLNLNIVDARVHHLNSNLVILSFVVLLSNGTSSTDLDLELISKKLRQQILDPLKNFRPRHNRLSRASKNFPIATTVRFSKAESRDLTLMEVVAQDRPGLLYAVAKALLSCKIRLVTAKIATFGEKAEDIFYITDRDGLPVDNESHQDALRAAIQDALPSASEYSFKKT